MSTETITEALSYADGTPVTAGDVVTIRQSRCTVLRVVPDNAGKPWVVVCLIDGMGEREMGVFASVFRSFQPSPEDRLQGRSTVCATGGCCDAASCSALIADLAAALNAFVEDEAFRAKGNPDEPRFQTPGWFARMNRSNYVLAQAALFLPDQKLAAQTIYGADDQPHTPTTQ